MDLCDFLAEDELIDIVPNFKYDRLINLISGDYGPFRPAIPVRVPLWMALNLYGQQKCKINVPEWISELKKIANEQDQSESLIEMPSRYWREVIRLFEAHHVPVNHDQQALKALIDRRENILIKSCHELLNSVVNLEDDRIAQVKIKNITKFELTRLKQDITENLRLSKWIASNSSSINDN